MLVRINGSVRVILKDLMDELVNCNILQTTLNVGGSPLEHWVNRWFTFDLLSVAQDQLDFLEVSEICLNNALE